MIVEIETPRSSVRGPLDYNEGKVLHGVAELVGYANMESTATQDIYSLFAKLETASWYPPREVSFHASVNPSPEDACDEEDILGFIVGLMEELGLGEQPYLIYRHFDIAREHYHVVSTRIRENGRKISNYYEKRRTLAYMKRVCRRFHFSMVEKGDKVRQEEDITMDKVPDGIPRFRPRLGVAPQLRSLYKVALCYEFDSFPEFACILEDLGVKATLIHSPSHPSITLQGLDKKGESATEIFSESTLGEPLYEQLSGVLSGAGRRPYHHRERARVRSLVGFAFEMSRSEGHFENILRKKGIHVHLSRARETGEVFGVTFVDHSTRTVVRASEIRDVFSVRMMREALSSQHWREEKQTQGRGAYVRSSRESARSETIRLRDLHVGAVARIMRPVGQPKGNSWSGKHRMSDEERRAKWDEGRAGAMNADFKDRRYEEKIK